MNLYKSTISQYILKVVLYNLSSISTHSFVRGIFFFFANYEQQTFIFMLKSGKMDYYLPTHQHRN